MFALLFAALASASSIYNPFDPLPGAPAPGPQVSLNLGGDLALGNLEAWKLKLGGGVVHLSPERELRLVGRADQAVTAEVRTAGRYFVHARYAHRLGETQLWGYGFAQADQNFFRRLTLRQVNGGGVEWRVPIGADLNFSVGTALMAELNRFATDTIDDDAGWHIRNSSFIAVQARLGARVSAGGSVFVQPRLDAPENLRALGQATMVYDLGPRVDPKGEVEPSFFDRFGSKLRYDLRVDHDTRPPEGVKPTDLIGELSLAFQWR